MSSRSITGWLIAIIFLGVLVGVVGGGMMGGVVGYYVARNQVPADAPAAVAQLAANKAAGSPTTVTNISVNENSAVEDAAKKASPAVVTIVNTLSQQAPSNLPNGHPNVSPDVATGSGFIVDSQGHIVTNAHVVDGAQQLDVVYSDGTKTSARLIGEDTVSDIAVVQVSGAVPAVLPFGDSNAHQLGQTAIAIGSPLGSYRGSVTVGVISGMNRAVDGTSQENLIQTDAAINHGNSGGPLLNLDGQVIGVNTLVVQNTSSGDLAEGLGFAIPSNTVQAVAQQLIAQGKVEYPFIGISYQQVTPETAGVMGLPVQEGVLVQQVSPGTPAEQAGLQQNDIITAMDNIKIDQAHPLRMLLFQHKIGDTVTLTVVRGSQTLTVKLTLVQRPAQTGSLIPS